MLPESAAPEDHVYLLGGIFSLLTFFFNHRYLLVEFARATYVRTWWNVQVRLL